MHERRTLAIKSTIQFVERKKNFTQRTSCVGDNKWKGEHQSQYECEEEDPKGLIFLLQSSRALR
jgi:hypothetical protein